MTVGPARRTKSAIDRSANSHDYSRSPRNSPRRVKTTRPNDGKGRKRVPFLVWLVSVSTYCFVMFMNMSTYRALRDSAYDQASSSPPQQRSSNPNRVASNEASSNNSQSPLADTSARKKDDEGAIDEPKDDESEDDVGNVPSFSLDRGIIHVVETRFMQNQSKLVELGLARLALFEAFCYPSMMRQSNGNFIWIIRADPQLHPAIAGTLRQILDGKPNFILIGSNDNPEGFSRSGLTFESFIGDAPLWSGNLTLVEEAYKKSAEGSVLLETRLDADDGLTRDFIKTVQEDATKYLINGNHTEDPNDHWRLWCIHSNIEWHPLNPFPETREVKEANLTMPEGYLILYSDAGAW